MFSSVFRRGLRVVALALLGALLTALPSHADEFPSADLKGKVVYLDFWASWCGPCRQSFPFMNELQRNLGPQGLVIVAVNVDQDRAEADRFLARYPADFRVLFDPQGRLAERYKVGGMPTSYIIGRDGKVVVSHAGFRQKDVESLTAMVQRALDAH